MLGTCQIASEQNKYLMNYRPKELDKAENDKEDLKQMHNNYFLLVQTLINQKAIEAPGNISHF